MKSPRHRLVLASAPPPRPFGVVSVAGIATLLGLLFGTLAAGAAETSSAILDLTVRDVATGASLAAEVVLGGERDGRPLARRERTGAAGRLVVDLPGTAGQVDLTVSAAGHLPIATRFAPTAGERIPVVVWLDRDEKARGGDLDFEALAAGLTPEGFAGIHGFVRDAALAPVAGAIVRFDGIGPTSLTDERGWFVLALPLLAAGGDEPPAVETLVVEVDGGRRLERRGVPLVSGVTRLLLDLPDGDAVATEEEPHKLLRLARGETIELSSDSPSEEGPAGDLESGAIAPTPDNVVVPLLSYVDPPPSIRVGTSCSCSTCSVVSVYTLETYVRQGVGDEWISSWDADSLKAGSIPYRSYGTYYVNNPIRTNYDICSTTCCQVNDTDTQTAVTNAVNATAGIVLLRNSAVFRAEYSAENNGWDDPADGLSCTNADLSCGDGSAGSPSTSWPCLSDSVCAGRGCFGHGRGTCQWGTQRWALNQGRDWVWIVNHYANGNGVGSGYRNSQLTTPIRVTAVAPTPAVVPAGGSFTVDVDTESGTETAHSQVLVGATISAAGLGSFSDAAGDTKVTVPVGVGAVSRPFAVSAAAPSGTYDLTVALWLDVDGDDVIDTASDLQMTSFVSAAAVTVGSPSGTCGAPIAITALPYSHTSTTVGRAAAIDGYSCPPSSGSEAGGEAVYALTLTEPGNLTVTVTDGAGVDIDPHLLSACAPAACLARNDTTFTFAVEPGTYWIVCDTWTSSGGTSYPGAYTLDVSFVSTAGDTVSPAAVSTITWSAAAGRWQWPAVTTNRLGGAETMGSYEILRSTVPSAAGSVVATVATAYWTDATNPPAGTTWFYTARAIDAAGNRESPALDAIVDNTAAVFAGAWSSSSATAGYYGTDYRFVATGGTGTKTATWSFACGETGLYDVKTIYPAGGNRSTGARFTVAKSSGSALVPWNQQLLGGSWNTLASVWLLGGVTYSVVLDDAEAAGFVVIADAVRWVKR